MSDGKRALGKLYHQRAANNIRELSFVHEMQKKPTEVKDEFSSVI